MSFQRILVSVDFSGASREAMREAARLAATLGSELTLVHVWQPPLATVTLPQGMLDDVVAAAKRLLVEWGQEAEGLGARRVTTSLLSGTPWHEIVELAGRDPPYDLIVVGTHGNSGIKHVLLGSVAERVLRHAPCPVLAVRAR